MAEPVYTSIQSEPLFLRDFSFTRILEYTRVLDEAHGIEHTHTSTIIKGQKLFKDKFVTNIGFTEPAPNVFLIKARVKAEMRKAVNYHVTCRIKHEGEVETGSCECPGGQSPACCKHVFALLAAVEDYSRKELYAAPTEKLQTWHTPQPYKVSPKKLKTEDPSKRDACTVDKTVDLNCLAALPSTAPIWSVLNTGSATLASDSVYYNKTLPLPAFVTSGLSTAFAQSVTADYDTLMYYFNHVRKPVSELCDLEFQTISQASCPL